MKTWFALASRAQGRENQALTLRTPPIVTVTGFAVVSPASPVHFVKVETTGVDIVWAVTETVAPVGK